MSNDINPYGISATVICPLEIGDYADNESSWISSIFLADIDNYPGKIMKTPLILFMMTLWLSSIPSS